MNWRKFLGDKSYQQVTEYLQDRNMSIAGFIKMLVNNFFENRGE